MTWRRLTLGPLGTNCYVYTIEEQALIIDPGGNSAVIMEEMDKLSVTPVAVLLTHAHFDHIGAVEEIRSHYSIPVYLHKDEWEWMKNPSLNGSSLFPVGEISGELPDHEIKEGPFHIGKFRFEVRYTPGHSPGSVSFVDHASRTVIAGDVLFNGGIGRTDLPGGDMDQLLSSIETKLYTLGDDYEVLPGHGPVTTIAKEMTDNPFIRK